MKQALAASASQRSAAMLFTTKLAKHSAMASTAKTLPGLSVKLIVPLREDLDEGRRADITGGLVQIHQLMHHREDLERVVLGGDLGAAAADAGRPFGRVHVGDRVDPVPVREGEARDIRVAVEPEEDVVAACAGVVGTVAEGDRRVEPRGRRAAALGQALHLVLVVEEVPQELEYLADRADVELELELRIAVGLRRVDPD